MFELRRGKNILWTAAVIAAFFIAAAAGEASAKGAKAKLPPYKPNGVIPGTELLYEKLAIGEDGMASIVIVNPTRHGVSFAANFSFYSDKDEYLTGFTVDGFADAGMRKFHSFELDNYKAYRRASTMKVLGRAGRARNAPDRGDGGE